MAAIKQRTVSRNLVIGILILGLVAFALYFYFFINPVQVADILSKTNVTIYAGAFVSYFLFAFFSALVWRQLLCNLSVKIRVRKALLFTWVGLFFETVVPQLGWSGEISKTYLLSKDSNQDPSKIGASVVAQKLFTISLTIIALSIGLTLLLFSYPLPFTDSFFVVFILALSILSLAIIYYVSVKPSATKTLLNWGLKIVLFFRKKWNPQKARLRAEEFLGRFHASIQDLGANPKTLVKPIIYAVVSFIFEVGVVFLSFYALGQSVPVSTVLIVFTLTGTLQTVGITMFGFTEIVMTSIFSFLGIPVYVSFSVTLLTRVVTLWFRLIISYMALQLAGIQIITKKAPS
jgi:uncharacterized protein (TIRG00374 family)